MDSIVTVPMTQVPEKEENTVGYKILTVVGVVLCVILVPILLLNCILLWRVHRHPDSVPKFGGVVPLIVQTDVLYPDIQMGDLIVCRSAKPEALQEGDIITFVKATTAEGIAIGVNRIAGIASEDGAWVITIEDKENEENRVREISEEDVIGVYRGRLPGLGKLILFMQTTQGLILCVFLPILLLVGYDVVRTRIWEKRSREETDRLAAELEALREARRGQAPED